MKDAPIAVPAVIPVIDAPAGPLQLARLHPARARQVLRMTRKLLPSPFLKWGDRHSLRWLQNAANPYLGEITEIVRLLDAPGGYALNLSFEWGCTTGYHAADYTTPPSMVRTLDWPFRLGADVVVARHRAQAGDYYNITWPGFVGVLTGLAPGRFAAAINQAPMTYSFNNSGLTLPVDWIVNRLRVRRRTAMPPAHLLRHVFDTCHNFDEALDLLTNTPLCIPAIFTLTGPQPGQGCIIERRENDACVHRERTDCVANHWINPGFTGRDRRIKSRKRRTRLLELLASVDAPFDWLQQPVMNAHTRLAVEMNAATGSLRVQGWHGPTPQTDILELSA